MNYKVFIILAILGFVLPYYFFISWIYENGVDFQLFISDIFANKLSSLFAVDVFISAISLMAIIWYDSKKYHLKYVYIPIIGTFTIGVSFGLPIYFLIRLKAIRK